MRTYTHRCFEGIPTQDPIILAVSGGSDSLALLLLANAWAKNSDASLHAVTIDHGLRPEAAAEAAFVASVCAGLGIDHVTLAWEGQKPVLGIQNAARQSRYALLDQYAHSIGAQTILTGHTLDDQAETVFMRLQRHKQKSDGNGLSGMSRVTWLYGGKAIYRPLLGLSRSTLRSTLNDFSQSWIEDPSNLDESYERVVVRKHLSKNPEVATQILALSNTCSKLRHVEAKQCAQLLDDNASLQKGGVFELSTNDILKQTSQASIAHPVFLRAAQCLLAMAGGQDYLVQRSKIKPILEKLLVDGETRATVGGAVVEKTTKGLRFYRESRNFTSLILEPGESAIWDGRLHLYNETPSAVFVEAGKRVLLRELEQENEKKFDLKPRMALWSTPILHLQTDVSKQAPKGKKSICLPLIDPSNVPAGLDLRLASPAIEHFCSEYDAPIKDWIHSLDRYVSASISPKN
ncbi:MAG: tRNA lysidine(34) synthetase TilS [Nitratireductor sp.]